MGFNKIAYTHTHKMANGVLLSHAHPYNKTNDSAPVKSHHHTSNEFVAFGHLSGLFIFTFLSLVLLVHFTCLFILSLDKSKYSILLTLSYNGRAPPFLLNS